MHERNESKSPKRRNAPPVARTLLAATVMGSLLGIVIADQDALPSLRIKTASLVSADASSIFTDLKAAFFDAVGQKAAVFKEKTASDVIETGLESVGTIHYSPKADSTQMTFNMQDMELIRTGKLSGPHRVYVDLKDICWEQDSFKGIKTLKALDINGDLISRVRIKQRESGITRIVLDLKRCCNFTYMIPHESPSHLIVQLQPV